jgi:hypothetical protein
MGFYSPTALQPSCQRLSGHKGNLHERIGEGVLKQRYKWVQQAASDHPLEVRHGPIVRQSVLPLKMPVGSAGRFAEKGNQLDASPAEE